jgi:hypothetical protein
MYNNDIGSMPPSQNRQARKRKRKIILMLRLSILVMAFIISMHHFSHRKKSFRIG